AITTSPATGSSSPAGSPTRPSTTRVGASSPSSRKAATSTATSRSSVPEPSSSRCEARAMTVARPAGPELGVNLSEASVLAHLRDSGPLTQTELARRIGTGRARMGAWIDGLVAKGAVERRSDPHDRRVWNVALTPAGHRLWQATAGIDRSIRKVLRAGSSPEDRARLDALLTLINRNADTLINGRPAGNGPAAPASPLR